MYNSYGQIRKLKVHGALSKYYYVRAYKNGKQKWISTKKTSLISAKKLIRRWEMEEAEEVMAEKSIVDIAVEDGRFTTLVAAVEAAGLAETLSGEGEFTVFAPTDDAFAALPEGTVESLLEDPEGALKSSRRAPNPLPCKRTLPVRDCNDRQILRPVVPMGYRQ